jgi:DNA-binding response OmpR family regulator
VDHDAAARRTVAEGLQAAGFRTRTAKGAVEAWRSATEERPDATVIAHKMPLHDGLELMYVLRTDSALATMPVILWLNRSPLIDGKEFLKSWHFQPEGTIYKPCTADDVVREVQRVLSHVPAQQNFD